MATLQDSYLAAVESGDKKALESIVKEGTHSQINPFNWNFFGWFEDKVVDEKLSYQQIKLTLDVMKEYGAIAPHSASALQRSAATVLFNAFETDDLKLAKIAMPYIKNLGEKVDHYVQKNASPHCRNEKEESHKEIRIDLYFFLRSLGKNAATDILLSANNLSSYDFFETYKRSLEVFANERSDKPHADFVKRVLPAIYDSGFFGEALDLAKQENDYAFLKEAARFIYDNADSAEEQEEALLLAHKIGWKKLENRIVDDMIKNITLDEEIASLSDELKKSNPIYQLASKLIEKMGRKHGIGYPDVRFGKFSGAYAQIKDFSDKLLYGENKHANASKHRTTA